MTANGVLSGSMPNALILTVLPPAAGNIPFLTLRGIDTIRSAVYTPQSQVST
jgi:hypothetical protein